jgi:3-methyladenine DNA glycosylase AlkD
MAPVLERWITSEDLWLRRTAILSQTRHRAQTDVPMLLDFCRRQASDRTFWIRKAIGWALREHAKTDPEAVRAFLVEMGDRLSPLSRGEAGKHL